MSTSNENTPETTSVSVPTMPSSAASKKPKATKVGYATAETAKSDRVVLNADGTFDTSVLSQSQMRFISKYIKSNGIISYACKLAKISRDTFYRWMAENKTFEALIQRANEEPLDVVRLKLWEQIQKGNINAITLYLRAHDKAYSERVSISGKLELSPSWYEDMKGKPRLGPVKRVLQETLGNQELKQLDKAIEGENTKEANKLLGGNDKTPSTQSNSDLAEPIESPALGTVPQLSGTTAEGIEENPIGVPGSSPLQPEPGVSGSGSDVSTEQT